MARDSARITPVAMPGIAAGRTWRQIVCHWVAPRAIEPSRIEGGTARMASRPAMITTGSTSSPRVSPPASTTLPWRERAAHEEGQAEDPVDDRRDRGQVLDVHLDRAVVPALTVGVLLEVDRGGHADRHDEHRDHSHQPDRAQQRRPDAGVGGHRRGVVGDEGQVDRADAVARATSTSSVPSRITDRPRHASRATAEGVPLTLRVSGAWPTAPATELIRRPACTCGRTGSRPCSSPA